VLNGGYQQWLDLDYPTQTKTQELKPSDFNAAFKDDWTVDASALLELDVNTQLLDARALPRYKGEVEPLDAKAGHIPRAINADFTKNLEANGTFKPVSSLSERFTPMRNKDVICYCGSGVTACHNILAMTEAGLPMPKLYPGSWSEWITDDSRPINHGTEGELN
jgi:thiosulfate/3-mercaptopyruvate sulfurtransferase